MSVYKPARTETYLYDFRFKGRRFHGSTGQKAKRAAEAVERKVREQAALGTLGSAAELTLDEAAGRWFQEKGADRAKPEEIERQLEQLLGLIGSDRKLLEITTEVVNFAVERRRGMTYRKSPKKDAKTYFPSNATVNRDVIDTLRPILNRAKKNWGAKGLPEINWGDLRLTEPRGAVKHYSREEQAAWLGECDPAARFPLQMLFTYGLRFGELFFKPDTFKDDSNGPRLEIRKRKRDVPLTLPLRKDDARNIAARVSRAKAAGLETIWFEEEKGEDDEVKLVPLTYHGLHARLKSAGKRAKVSPGRIIHGTRHHAGTTILSRTKNLKMAQQLLGHASIQSTMRYAHALTSELQEALEAESRNSPEAETAESGKDSENKAQG